jgi:hypothetical protein
MPTFNIYRGFGEKFLDDIMIYIGQTFDPQDIFDDQQLSARAESNGYTKEE